MKEWLLKAPDHWQTMLSNVPGRPSASGKSASSKFLTASPANEMKGLLTKYNWEYRRPSPNQFAMLDHWTKSQSMLDPAMLKLFLGGDYHIPQDDLRHTMLWEKGGCGLDVLGKYGQFGRWRIDREFDARSRFCGSLGILLPQCYKGVLPFILLLAGDRVHSR